MDQQQEQQKNIVICALYKFVRFEDFKEYQPKLLQFMKDNEVFGSLLLASEGINGTVSGTRKAIDSLLEFLNSNKILTPIEYKESYMDKNPFLKTKVKLKEEIVHMGVEGIDPNQVVGTYVEPKDWNKIISDPDTITIDTRNDYEYQIGTFKNAVNPKTHIFTEFPDYVQKNLDPKKHKKVAMFCTGGIRCEKSTAYMKQQGYEEVYHLKGGILKYLEEVPKDKTMWEGECFVFDERIAVDHDLQPGKTKQFYTGPPGMEGQSQKPKQQDQQQQGAAKERKKKEKTKKVREPKKKHIKKMERLAKAKQEQQEQQQQESNREQQQNEA